MLQFQGEQYTVEELTYIYSALMMIQISGEQAKMLVNLQEKTQNMINMISSAPVPTPSKKPGPPGKK